MGKYTVYDDPRIDEEIEKQLGKIVSILVKNIPNIHSIILTGGFGRGEGSIKLEEGGKILPLKDYDLVIIVTGSISKETLNQIYGQVHSVMGLSNSEERMFRFSDFVIDLCFTTLKKLSLLPDISGYELKIASYLLYGEDVRNRIPWNVTDIPLASGWRLLFEKMTGLIGHFPKEYPLKGNGNHHSEELLIYECQKTYVEIATALTILMGCYAPSYSRRKQLFENNFYKKLPELYEKLPYLPDFVAKATDFKLRPTFENFKNDPSDLWFNTRNTLLVVSKFYLEKFLGIEVNDFVECRKLVIDRLRKKYYNHMASALARNLIKVHIPLLNDFSNLGLQLYFNSRFFLRIYRSYHYLPFQIFRSPTTSVTLQLHTIAPQVLLSIRKDGCIDERYFKSAKNALSCISTYNKIESFEDMRMAYLMTYSHIVDL
jgi:hypothetical protein